jgi:hypothetical protein
VRLEHWMTTLLVAATVLLVALPGAGVVWVCAAWPRLAPEDRVVCAPVLAVLFFALLTFLALILPWGFHLTATIGFVAWVGGAAVLLARREARAVVGATFARAWVLVVPLACCFLAVAAFSAVQGDPPATVAYPGSVVSARVANLPPDHLFPVGAAQTFQHGLDPMDRRFFGIWDFSDRTPLAGAVAASVTSGVGIELPRTSLWKLPARDLRPELIDDLGYWQSELVLVLLNAFVVLAIGRLAWSIAGRRAALIAGLLAAMNPFVLTHSFFTWPKMLAAFFVLLHYVCVRERRSGVLVGATAALAYLAHPLSALFVIPSLVVSCRRGVRSIAASLGTIVVLLAPWQIWTLAYAHPSRMLTYPLGYTMQDPDQLGDELRVAWHQFTDAGIGHALRVRWDVLESTFWPFDPARNYLTLPGRHLSLAESWFTVHDRTIGGMALFVLVPLCGYGIVVWQRRARWEWSWMLVAPLVVAVLFWGIDPQGLGAAMLQPTAAMLAVVAALGVARLGRWPGFAVVALATVEAASSVWWGALSVRPGVGAVGVVVAIAIWSVAPALLVVTVVRGRPAARARNGGGNAGTPSALGASAVLTDR